MFCFVLIGRIVFGIVLVGNLDGSHTKWYKTKRNERKKKKCITKNMKTNHKNITENFTNFTTKRAKMKWAILYHESSSNKNTAKQTSIFEEKIRHYLVYMIIFIWNDSFLSVDENGGSGRRQRRKKRKRKTKQLVANGILVPFNDVWCFDYIQFGIECALQSC